MISDFHLSDLGNARRFVTEHAINISFVPSWGWLHYDGKVWRRDESGEIPRRAKETIISLYEKAHLNTNEAERKELIRHALRSESKAAIEHMIALAETEIDVIARPTLYDTDPLQLNCLNGTLDLKTGELKPHNQADMLTKLIHVNYDSDATCPIFEKFLMRILDSNVSLINFVQRIIGYSLTGDVSEQCLFILHGTGANGKSTLLNTIQSLLSGYAMQCPSDTFIAKQNQNIPNDVARLAGARLVSIMETENGKRLAEGLVKSVTGGDTIVARFLHKEFFEFKPQFKLWLSTNHKPIIRGNDYAIWRRIKLIPFNVTFRSFEQDKHLERKIKAELPGVLNWAIKGCLQWQEEGLGVPEEVGAAITSYQNEMADNVFQFIENKCTPDPVSRIQAKVLFENYLYWCTDNGDEGVSQKIFKHRLYDMGHKQNRTGKNGCYEWQGLRLKTEAESESLKENDLLKSTEQKNRVFSNINSYKENPKKRFSNNQNTSVASVNDASVLNQEVSL